MLSTFIKNRTTLSLKWLKGNLKFAQVVPESQRVRAIKQLNTHSVGLAKVGNLLIAIEISV